MKARRSRMATKDGFTLLEAVLAITLFAVLAVILYGAFSVGHRAIEKTQVVFDTNQKFRSAFDLLGSYVRSSLPYRSSPQAPEIFYAGEETQVLEGVEEEGDETRHGARLKRAPRPDATPRG